MKTNMKFLQLNSLLLITILLFSCNSNQQIAELPDEISIIPMPQKVEKTEAIFKITSDTEIGGIGEFKLAANHLISTIEKSTGKKIKKNPF